MADPTTPILTAGCDITKAVVEALPGLAWPLLVSLLLLLTWRHLSRILRNIAVRIAQGAAFKVGNIEIRSAASNFASQGSKGVDADEGHYFVDKTRAGARSKHYDECRGCMLVHQIQSNHEKSEWYDILIYIIPKKDESLLQLIKVEYYFGHAWDHRVYPSTDRSKGFAIFTSAWGPMLCQARLFFNDGETVEVYRYIDFEMGKAASSNPPADRP